MTTKASKPNQQPTAKSEQGKAILTRQAQFTVVPELNAAGLMESFNIHDKPDVLEMMAELVKRGDAIVRGDTKGIERMLIAQAHALDSMFASLARRAKNQDNLAPYEAHLKFALRAQAQCRATLETLAAIKNPPNVAFVKQANIASGPQQVNNHAASPASHTRVEEKTNPPNELLEHEHAQRLDTGTARTASAGDPIMATVETVHRPAHRGRKGRSEP
jgi:hypothetical protein